jgi:hypothetical protein
MCLLADGRAIGTVGLHELDLSSENAVFGISIGEKDKWNKATAPIPSRQSVTLASASSASSVSCT